MALAQKPDSAQPWNLRMLAEMPVAAVHFRSSCSFWSCIPPFSEHLVLSEIRVHLDLNGHVGIYPIDKPTSRLVLDIQTFISFQPSVSAEAPVFPELRSYARVALWRQVVTEHDGFEPFH